jgi:hypothetical protein
VEADDVLGGIVVDVGGVPMRLRAADAARAEAVASLFRHATVEADEPVATVEFAAATPDVPARAPSTAAPYVDLWHEGPGALVLRTTAGLVAWSEPDRLWVGGAAPELTREFRFAALVGLTHLLAQHDRHLVHGAALLVDDGAVLVIGPTGTGKSTLAFAAHGLGWPVLADDAVLLRRAGDGVVARGLPRPIAVAADVVTAVTGGRPVPDDPRRRTELPVGTLAAGDHPVVALAETTGADPRGPAVAPLAGVDALRAVLRASVSLADADARPALFAVAGSLARLPTWSLRHGTDPRSALADATELLGTLRRLLTDPP